MVRNEEKYDQAVSLRKRGFTLEEIAKYCDVSKSTASKWLQNKVFSAQVTIQNQKRARAENARRLKLIGKAHTTERAKKYKEVIKSSETEFKHYKKDPLFVAGLMLYLGSGDLVDKGTVRLSTGRIEAHRVFVRFATEYLGIEKDSIHIWLQLSPLQNEETCMKKWRRVTTLTYSQFYKNQVVNLGGKNKPLHYGVGNTLVRNTVLKKKLVRWIELLTKSL